MNGKMIKFNALIVKLIKSNRFFKELIRAIINSQVPEWRSVKNFNRPVARIQGNEESSKILVATGGGGYAAAKFIESLIAKALVLRGAQVEVLLCDGLLPACFQTEISYDSNERRFAKNGPSPINCATCHKSAVRTYTALGIKIVNMSSLISEDELADCRLLSQEASFADLKNYRVNNVNVGEHALAGTLRFYAKSILDDMHSEQVFRRYFEASLITNAVCNNLFRINKYTRVVLHHGIYVPQGVIAENAMSHAIPTTTWNVAYRKQCFIFSHDGTYHRTLLSEKNSNWENMEFGEAKIAKIQNYLYTDLKLPFLK